MNPGPDIRSGLRAAGARDGQALVELVIAMVAVLALAVALLQIGRLGRAQARAMQDARARADELALSEIFTAPSPRPSFLRDWHPGPDRIAHTRDDRALAGEPGRIRSALSAIVRPGDLEGPLGPNRISILLEAGDPMAAMDWIRGDAEPVVVPLMPAARRLFYDADAIVLEAETWMPWTRGIP